MEAAAVVVGQTPLPVSGPSEPVVVHVSGTTGFVWDAAGAWPPAAASHGRPAEASAAARRLRESCRLVGAMVGALAGFRQQDAVHGLPLQLSADEITLAVERGAHVGGGHSGFSRSRSRSPAGWVTLTSAAPPEPPDEKPPAVVVAPKSISGGKKAKTSVSWNSLALRKSTAAAIESADLARGAGRELEEKPWKARSAGHVFALATLTLPPPLQKLASADGKVLVAVTTAAPCAGKAAKPLQPPPVWTHPATAAEALRYRVFLDLHERGCGCDSVSLAAEADPATRRYTMTSGAKFGGDYLAYPGDPVLYHAQYTVRCVHHDAPQHPLALAAATRMAHAARCAPSAIACASRPEQPAPPSKHVVLASVHPAPEGAPLREARIDYLTFAPDIQQSTNRDRSLAHARITVPLAAQPAAAADVGMTEVEPEGGKAAPQELLAS